MDICPRHCMAYYGSDCIRGCSQWQHRIASAVDHTQLRAYDHFCNGENVEGLPNSRLLRRGTGLDLASGNVAIYKGRALLAQRFHKA